MSGLLAPPQGISSARASKRGASLFVDSANGVDASGLRGRADRPFLTPAAALAAASPDDIVIVRPGTYSLAADIAIPAEVTLQGVDRPSVILQRLAVVATAVLVTLGDKSRLAGLTLKLSTATNGVSLTGVLVPSAGSPASVSIEDCRIEVTSTAPGGVADFIAVRNLSADAPSRDHKHVRGTDILVTVPNNVTGKKHGVSTEAGNFHVQDSNVTVPSGSGSLRIGLEVNAVGGRLTVEGGGVSAQAGDFKQTDGTLEAGHVDLLGGPSVGTITPLIVEGIAKNLRETGGPTTLAMGAVADGQVLKRVGASVVGAAVADSFVPIHWKPDPATNPSRVSIAQVFGIELTDGSTKGVVATLPPQQVTPSVNPVVRIPYFVSTGAANGNVRMSLTARHIADGELVSKAADETILQTVAVVGTADRMAEMSFTLTAALIAAGDKVNLHLERLGADGLDTFTGDIAIAEDAGSFK